MQDTIRFIALEMSKQQFKYHIRGTDSNNLCASNYRFNQNFGSVFFKTLAGYGYLYREQTQLNMLGIEPLKNVHKKHVSVSLLIYALDRRNTKKANTKMVNVYQQQSYFSQIVKEKAKILTYSFMKKSKNNNITLGFSF